MTMIIARSPLRITLGGGGTDLPSYYREHEGFLIAAAIDRYVYITLAHDFRRLPDRQVFETRIGDLVEELQHPIIREALKMLNVPCRRLEIASMADIPAGTGLGSSGSFTTALLRALHTYQKNIVSPQTIAEQACEIEIDRLGEPIGKQDQFIAAFGGVTCFRFKKRRHRRGASGAAFCGNAAQPRRRPGDVLHRHGAVGILDPAIPGREVEG